MQNSYFSIVETAIRELNIKNEEENMDVKPDTVLLGTASTLDSIDLINLIVAIEDKIKTKYGQSITLVNERAMSSEDSPFGTVSSLVGYLEELVSETESG